MQVKIHLKKWEVIKKDEIRDPILSGEYTVNIGESVIASQSFNGDYGGKKFPFSGELVKKVSDLESEILKEIQDTLS